MVILVNLVGYENAPWVEHLQSELPQFEVIEPAQIKDPATIRYAAIWCHPHNQLHGFANLRAILNLGAGADHIDKDPSLTKMEGIPVVRLLDPDVGMDMAHYAIYWSMHFQRGYERYRQQTEQNHWQRHISPRIKDWRVTVLGLGRIGTFVAEQIAQMGFQAQAWNRSAKTLDEVEVFTGYEQLANALQSSDVVVNCLPLTEATTAIINQERLNQLPTGSYLINMSRGAVIDEPALIKALQTGQLAGAALDCFAEEPLAASSALWSMQNVHITPHMSGATYARACAPVVAENIRRIERGEKPFPIHRTTHKTTDNSV